MIQMIPLRQILDFYIRPFVELSYICEFAWDGNDVHLSGVGKLEHGARLILARVLQDDDRMLAGCRLQDVPEVRRHRGEDHLVRIQGAPVRAR